MSLLQTLFSVVVLYLGAANPQTTTSVYVEPGVPTGTPIPGNYSGPLRPQVHFSPPQHYMNDPNGLFRDANGTWHLYYQYNPTNIVAGNQHWGHATSTDLYHWINQQIAIFPPNNISQVYTGSAVVDVNNTSGFFPDQDNGVVAIYTLNEPTKEVQAISYSRDGGFTFTAYEGNPVIDSTSTQFRDPKVIWYNDHWAMVVAYAADLVIGIYTSPDLKEWTHASNFSHPGLGDPYECPNLVSLPVDGVDAGLYLLAISTGTPLDGSITKYLLGTFNGTHFAPVDDTPRILDFGKDNYASQWFSGFPAGADAVSFGWASNGRYAQATPTETENWRSPMTLPRRNYLTNATGFLDFVSVPHDLSPVLRQLAVNEILFNSNLTIDYAGVASNALYFEANISAAAPEGALFNFTFASATSGESIIGGYALGAKSSFALDRGNTRGFNNSDFTPTFVTSVLPAGATGMWSMAGLIDRSIFEVFLNGGVQSATTTFFAAQPLTVLTFSTAGFSEGAVVSVKVWAVKSAWAAEEDGSGIVVGNVTSASADKRSGVHRKALNVLW